MKYLKTILFISLFFLSIIQLGIAAEYKAHILPKDKSISRYDFEKITIPIKVKNIGTKKWDSQDEKFPIFISYHLLTKNNKIVSQDNLRTQFPKEITPGEAIILELNVASHPVGEYIVKVDLVVEGLTWFKEQGSQELSLPLEILESQKEIKKPKITKYNSQLEWYIKGEQAINYCSLLSNKILTGNFQEFKFNKAPVYGFTAGASYPQIWIRDSATIMPISRYTYSQSILISWIKAHLSIQKENGELQDWIARNDKYEKNSIETDQETSLIIAAHEISKTIGNHWLQEKINSRSILLRLQNALHYVYFQRRDLKTGLIKSGHTADWGDVSNEFPDQRSVDIHPNSTEVTGIYTNALAYGAAIKLSSLLQETENQAQADFWKEQAKELRKNIQANLWQPDKGFFRTHRHVNRKKHKTFNEGNIFPMGGNAVAIEMGVTIPKQTNSIIHQAISRQKLFNISTISGVLLPPYPKDFFQHPALNDYFEYQNGGQWDWFGARLIQQMFQANHPQALNKLKEICNKAYQNKGLYEWDTVDGKGQGSSHYAGSAAVISKAVVEGLFGIDWKNKSLKITPYLALGSARIFVPQRASNTYLLYELKEPTSINETHRVNLIFDSNIKEPKLLILPKIYNKQSDITIQINGETVMKRTNETHIEIDLINGKNNITIEYK